MTRYQDRVHRKVFPTLVLLPALVCQCATLPTASTNETKAKIRSESPVASSAVASKELEFDKHVDELRKRLPANDFSIVVQPPFVVVGDEPRVTVQAHARDTVKWAVDRLKQDFFLNDPEEILDIWLFKDDASYRKNARLLFNDEPTTPYGYYSSRHKALIMNIGTGTGTLVHELVHPFVEANFPSCPPWLNEGLGSLYERCGEVNGHIHGYVNWRLPGLQRAIRSGEVPQFKALTAMDANEFYGDSKGTNYAQARYLCYYLQEKDLLTTFYKEFHSNHRDDPTGYKSLQKVLGERDMDAFKRRWERYILGLSQGFSVLIKP